jgi:AraC-like DNA-binding protein
MNQLKEPPAHLPFLNLPASSQQCVDPVDHGSALQSFLPVRICHWDTPSEPKAFQNHSGAIHLGPITLLATWGSAVDGQVEIQGGKQAQLILPYVAGVNTYAIGGQTFHSRTSAFFIPARHALLRVTNTFTSGVVISFPPDSLASVALAMAGPGACLQALEEAINQPALLSRRQDPRRDHLHQLLISTLALINSAMASACSVHSMMRLDDLILRLLAMLLVPQLLDGAELKSDRPHPDAAFPLSELLEWLMAHLDKPVSLSQIEQRSCYSRRSIQAMFNQRFGCGPMQWLRRQRLDQALAILQQPPVTATVAAVAQACGYLSPAAFSRDFVARYGIRPSALLRRKADNRLAQPSPQTSV